MRKLRLDGRSLSTADLRPVLAGEPVELQTDSRAVRDVERARDMVERCVDSGEAVYGLTTGFGKLKNVAIERDDLEQLQENLVLSHCCGVGEPLSYGEVRAVQVLRLNALLRGHSGVRVALVEKLVRLFNKGFAPRVPEQGSVGASGDLAPLAHMAAAYMGHGRASIDRVEKDAADALTIVGEEPMRLEAKEGLALINGTEVMAAIGAGVYLRAINASKAADAIASLTVESLFGSEKPFDVRLAVLKGLAGHERTAENMHLLLAGSRVMESHVDCGRVQDPYSLRCIPQVHGAFKDALAHAGGVLEAEMNSVTDNPVLFPDTGEVISAGQFHGQSLSMVLDYLALALTTLGNISERRTEQLVNPDLSELPAFLAPEPGLNSGLMMAQVTVAALASENKSLAHPASVDSIPTSANQEDHVSMGVTAARKARSIVTNVERILAIELMCAAQAHGFHKDLEPGRGATAVYETVRERVRRLERDRYLHADIEALTDLVCSGELVRRIEGAVGTLKS